jgi:hypothetical protein
MNTLHQILKVIKVIGLLLTLGISVSACAGNAWKEEVLLHDGTKLIVERSVSRGGRHEIGQSPPFSEQRLTFTMPGTGERVTWKDEFTANVGSANFLPLQLEISNNRAYLTTTPAGCLSYNKWDRPNPPYVIFQLQDKQWKRITLQELPEEFKALNLIISSPDVAVEKSGQRFISAEMIKKINSTAQQSEFKAIVREPISVERLCPDWSSPRYKSPRAPLKIE